MGNYWVERFEKHAVHQSIEALKAALTDARKRGGDEGIDAALSRLELVADHLRRAVSSIDPFLVSVSTLDQLVAGIGPMTSETQVYVSEGASGNLTNANANADTLIPLLHALLVPTVPGNAVDLGTSINALRSAMDLQLAHVKESTAKQVAALTDLQAKIEEAKADVQAQLEATRAEVTAQKARLDAALSQFQTQSSTAETARQTAFAESENQRQSTATAADLKRSELFAAGEEQRRAQFTATSEERASTFDSMRVEWTELSTNARTSHDEDSRSRKDAFEASVTANKATLDATIADAKATLIAWEKDAKERGDAGIAALEAKKEEAKKLVHVIGNTGMTGGYQRVADAAQATAKNWEKIAVVAMFGLIAFAVYAFVHTVDGDFKWGVFAGRAFVAVTCGVLATYAAQQSQKHRNTEMRSRKLELELASIDPYLASLPPEKQIEVKEMMAQRFFGQALPETKEAPAGGNVIELARVTVETAGKAIDMVKK